MRHPAHEWSTPPTSSGAGVISIMEGEVPMDSVDPQVSPDTKTVHLRWICVTPGAFKVLGGSRNYHQGHFRSECPTPSPVRNCCKWCFPEKLFSPLSDDTNVVHLLQLVLELSHFASIPLWLTTDWLHYTGLIAYITWSQRIISC